MDEQFAETTETVMREEETTYEREPSDVSSIVSTEEELESLDKVFSLTTERFSRDLPRRKYKTKSRLSIGIPHANTVSAMPDYERQKKLEQSELKQGRLNLRRVDAASMIV
mmetsp:Transcript_11015/g.21589  ORF Transcript_11015/g.21589 Transcript_11015/m.21589 type:complete len:111 (+) Transcript_11015:1709-2041(+)|eukprot:CAMPEP_0204904322 /NCGR_PEP_ID=MMETSP1397-20131031/4797_1 /ASSEMBLY_ACC=CAM_ASM_000891 /TAXON_ID=49980 /ORGANISM="Climacostomum Climacostomum virens, Strain Stock W-24" /LENGTH=110 /DNA_ID=CAMNT_0052073103 /DNA_START=1688 /DNA_END=2020 /DNA_ORIENTATION=+